MKWIYYVIFFIAPDRTNKFWLDVSIGFAWESFQFRYKNEKEDIDE